MSGEHGIGVSKAQYLRLEQSEELIALQRDIKRAFDPRDLLNPGKIFRPTAASGLLGRPPHPGLHAFPRAARASTGDDAHVAWRVAVVAPASERTSRAARRRMRRTRPRTRGALEPVTRAHDLEHRDAYAREARGSRAPSGLVHARPGEASEVLDAAEASSSLPLRSALAGKRPTRLAAASIPSTTARFATQRAVERFERAHPGTRADAHQRVDVDRAGCLGREGGCPPSECPTTTTGSFPRARERAHDTTAGRSAWTRSSYV